MELLAKKIPFLSLWSAVAVKDKDERPWMHGTEVGYRSDDHNVKKLHDKSDQDRIYNYKNQETCKGYPNHNIRLYMKRDIEEQQVTNNRQTCRLLYRTILTQAIQRY